MSNSDAMFIAPAMHCTVGVLMLDETINEPVSVPPDTGKKLDMVLDGANREVVLLENVVNATAVRKLERVLEGANCDVV